MSIVFGGNDSFGFTNDSINVAFGLKADTNMLTECNAYDPEKGWVKGAFPFKRTFLL